jgi:thioesterase domain-containing protein
MERRGMPTDLVCAIDSYVPGAFFVKKPLEKLAQHVSNLVSLSPREAYEYLGGRIRRRLAWLGLGLSRETDLQRRLREAEEIGRQVMRRYRPSHFGGEVSLFRANVQDDWISVQDDSGTGGWGSLCAGVDVTMIDCGHMEFFREPHLSSLARHLDAMLRQRSPRK